MPACVAVACPLDDFPSHLGLLGSSALLSLRRNGAFNVLVATCIGEEGLDIPQARLLCSHCTWLHAIS